MYCREIKHAQNQTWIALVHENPHGYNKNPSLLDEFPVWQGRGIEPTLTVLETVVLPLYDALNIICILNFMRPWYDEANF